MFAKSLVVRGKRGIRVNWDTLGAELYRNGMVIALTRIDNGPVQMITTFHNVGPEHTVNRAERVQR